MREGAPELVLNQDVPFLPRLKDPKYDAFPSPVQRDYRGRKDISRKMAAATNISQRANGRR